MLSLDNDTKMSLKNKITRGIVAGGIGLATLLSDGCASTGDPIADIFTGIGLQGLAGKSYDGTKMGTAAGHTLNAAGTGMIMRGQIEGQKEAIREGINQSNISQPNYTNSQPQEGHYEMQEHNVWHPPFNGKPGYFTRNQFNVFVPDNSPVYVSSPRKVLKEFYLDVWHPPHNGKPGYFTKNKFKEWVDE